MTKVNLYAIRKKLTLILGSIGLIGIIIITNDSFNSRSEFSIGIFIVLLFNFYQYFIFKKQFFHIDKKFIEWKFPDLTDPKRIEIQSEQPEFNFSWKGISIKDSEQLHEISLDGLWKKDRRKIQSIIEKVFKLN
ncbi:MAG: hypothetical protein RJQ00_03150 [Vicingaceae bacterium]